MFDNRKCRFVEFIDQLNGGIDVDQIIIRYFLAMQLCKNLIPVTKKNSLLMRIFSIPQTLLRSILYHLPFVSGMKIIIDRQVVSGYYFKGPGCKRFSLLKCNVTILIF